MGDRERADFIVMDVGTVRAAIDKRTKEEEQKKNRNTEKKKCTGGNRKNSELFSLFLLWYEIKIGMGINGDR